MFLKDFFFKKLILKKVNRLQQEHEKLPSMQRFKRTDTVKPVLSGHPKKDQKLVFKTDYRLMQVKSIAECSKREHSAILSTCIKLPSVFKTFVLSILEWPLKTGLTVTILQTPDRYQEERLHRPPTPP